MREKPAQSRNSLGFDGIYEYYVQGGSVWQAPLSQAPNPMSGCRPGRWLCDWSAWPLYETSVCPYGGTYKMEDNA